MYQLRKRSQSIRQEIPDDSDECCSFSEEDSEDPSEEVKHQPIEAGSHINESYLEDTHHMTSTMETQKPTQHKSRLVDTAMQTSGDWQRILSTFEMSAKPRFSNLSSELKLAVEEAVAPEQIEMQALSCSSGAEETHSYCNKGYESDGQAIIHENAPGLNGSEPVRQHYTERETGFSSALLETNNHTAKSIKQAGKSVKFTGCEIIGENGEASQIGINEVTDILQRDLLFPEKVLADRNQFTTQEDKWYRIRCMDVQQRVC